MKLKMLACSEAMADINMIVRHGVFKDPRATHDIINSIENTLLRFASGRDSGVPLQFADAELGGIRCGVIGMATDCRVFYRATPECIELLRVLSCSDELVRMLFDMVSEKTA